MFSRFIEAEEAWGSASCTCCPGETLRPDVGLKWLAARHVKPYRVQTQAEMDPKTRGREVGTQTMSRTLLNTVKQHIEGREQGDKSVTQAAANPTATQVAAKLDSEAKTPAIAAVKKRNKHTDKTDQPVDDDSGEGSSMPPDTQSGVKPTDTQSEAEATENPSAISLLKVEEQQVPIATSTVHRRQYRTTQDAVIPIHKIIRKLETQGVVSKTHSPFNSPIWPVRKSDGEWKLTVDYRALNKVTPPLSAAVPDMLELQYELESKAAKWYATIDIANAFFSIPLAAECRPQFAFT
ncbi:hypothetical protein DUI87_01617 [Hirundo rustica rustica]|uniref:ribonuclease H n=1 Tax=Hirundo rustica rustica TaxID=333673 RepID=A0A3M0L5T9_HIRRU|nr:hypothetical protein DUI87_01617 [Hirundo rustica rustica]